MLVDMQHIDDGHVLVAPVYELPQIDGFGTDIEDHLVVLYMSLGTAVMLKSVFEGRLPNS